MGTEVLMPQDLLVERYHVAPATFQRRRNFPVGGNLPNLIVNRKPNNTGHKKTSPRSDKKKVHTTTVENGGTKKAKATHGGAAEPRRKDDGTNKAMSMGQVTLLRRGQSLDSVTSRIKGGTTKAKSSRHEIVDDLAVCGTERIGPDSPVMVPKQIRLAAPAFDMYAGSGFSLSPSPRSVPLPSFFNKKQQIDSENSENKPFDDSATRDLRRLLRLD